MKYIILLILLMPFIYGESVETISVSSGGLESYSKSITDIEVNDIYQPRVSYLLDGTGIPIEAYDLTVRVLEKKYYQGDKVYAVIQIYNIWNEPDYDARLTYFLLDEDGKRVGQTLEQIMEAQVGKTNYSRTILLPIDAKIGEWKFYAEYNTTRQPTVRAYAPFYVNKRQNVFQRYKYIIYCILFILLIIILLIFFKERYNKSVI